MQLGMKTVLVVDDESEIVELVALLLEGHVSVLPAYDGESALEIVRECRPDLVLADMIMPRLDGQELCRLIRSDPAIRATKIILMSAGLRMDPAGCQADAHIAKPFDVADLTDTVNQLLLETV